MAESKKNKESAIEKARKKRIALAKEIQVELKEESNEREKFRKYFLKLSKKQKLPKYLEDVIWVHLKTIKCAEEKLFDKGVSHFGYKV